MQDLRPDLRQVAELVPEGSKVLDLGCGEGELLSWLVRNKQVDGRGIELSQEKVNRAIASGLSVIQGDMNSDLEYYPDGGYDIVILSQTLQAMQDPKRTLGEILRIGRQGVVALPNFGHWKNRIYLGVKGRMPVTKTLTYEWYDTPNIHFCTITDFVILCEEMGISISQRICVNHQGVPSRFSGRGVWANLFGEQGVFLIEKPGK